MSIGTPTPQPNSAPGDGPASPRWPTRDEVGQIAHEVRRWAAASGKVREVTLYTHPQRPTVRCAVVSMTRTYDPALDDAVTKLDLDLARHPDLAGIDVEIRLLFAAGPDQVAAWARGWEPWLDA
jgi:hypothetical protein